ncbi:putative reverse transcriptase domain-containing protein [Tanacetum coccineum]
MFEDEEQEEAFQILKNKLCNALVLALPYGPEDFVVYCNVSGLGLGCVLMRRGKVISYASRQLKIHEKNYTTHDLELGAVLFSDHDCEIHYHPGKANVVANALSRKGRIKPRRLQAMNMAIESDEAWYYLDRIWVLLIGDVRTLIMDEAYKLKYLVHPGADKIYYDLRDMYWPSGLLQQPEIPEWKWERIALDFVMKLPRSSGHDTLPYEIIAKHGVPILIIFDRDSRFTSRFWQSMQEALGTRLDNEYVLPSIDRWSKRAYNSNLGRHAQSIHHGLRGKLGRSSSIGRVFL